MLYAASEAALPPGQLTVERRCARPPLDTGSRPLADVRSARCWLPNSFRFVVSRTIRGIRSQRSLVSAERCPGGCVLAEPEPESNDELGGLSSLCPFRDAPLEEDCPSCNHARLPSCF